MISSANHAVTFVVRAAVVVFALFEFDRRRRCSALANALAPAWGAEPSSLARKHLFKQQHIWKTETRQHLLTHETDEGANKQQTKLTATTLMANERNEQQEQNGKITNTRRMNDNYVQQRITASLQ